MKARAGLWIDHGKAVIVALTDRGEEIRLVVSPVNRQLRRAGDSPLRGSFESQMSPASDSRQRALKQQLDLYYDAVIATIRDCSSLVVFGPGEAKIELRKRLRKHRLDDRLLAVESADKMTDRQVAARVRKFFGV